MPLRRLDTNRSIGGLFQVRHPREEPAPECFSRGGNDDQKQRLIYFEAGSGRERIRNRARLPRAPWIDTRGPGKPVGQMIESKVVTRLRFKPVNDGSEQLIAIDFENSSPPLSAIPHDRVPSAPGASVTDLTM